MFELLLYYTQNSITLCPVSPLDGLRCLKLSHCHVVIVILHLYRGSSLSVSVCLNAFAQFSRYRAETLWGFCGGGGGLGCCNGPGNAGNPASILYNEIKYNEIKCGILFHPPEIYLNNVQRLKPASRAGHYRTLCCLCKTIKMLPPRSKMLPPSFKNVAPSLDYI